MNETKVLCNSCSEKCPKVSMIEVSHLKTVVLKMQMSFTLVRHQKIAGPSPFPCCSFVCITRYETTVGFQHLKSPWSDDDHRYVTPYSKIFSVATESLRHIRLNMSPSAPRILAVLSNHIWPSSPEETSPHDKELFKRKEFKRLRKEEWNEFREHLEVLWECFF